MEVERVAVSEADQAQGYLGRYESIKTTTHVRRRFNAFQKLMSLFEMLVMLRYQSMSSQLRPSIFCSCCGKGPPPPPLYPKPFS